MMSSEVVTSREEFKSINESLPDNGVGDPPDGGLRAWLAVTGGFLTYCVTFGKSSHIPDGVIFNTYLCRDSCLIRLLLFPQDC